ncbi:MAG: hypothetical protein GXP56_04075 [Deltaproteobacteria bacterium]|nr:hypothetical protein [Deltaproteobacteria bacterium]
MTHTTSDTLASLYGLMDETWDKIASAYNFKCNGCKDNCCKSLFFHHTFIEQAYLLRGFNLLDHGLRKKILDRAKQYCKKIFSQTSGIKSMKIYCPVNENGRCLLYPYRPMICRLHGLPHELNRPGLNTVKRPGCDAGLFNDKTYIQFDRTPFYQKMARIEMMFRQDQNKTGKIKQTIAQILLSQ